MTPQEQQAYEAILANLHAALKRWYSNDNSGYAELFASRFTYFDPMTEERLETPAQMREHYARHYTDINLPRYELLDPAFQLEDDTAILTYFLKQYSDEGPAGPTWKTTEVYRPTNGGWSIIHAHWSAIPPVE